MKKIADVKPKLGRPFGKTAPLVSISARISPTLAEWIDEWMDGKPYSRSEAVATLLQLARESEERKEARRKK